MRICHFSDWHWSMYRLPEADLHVCTGDMLYNFTDNLKREMKMQAASIVRFQTKLDQHGKRGFRQYLKSPDSPIVAVRGNHDFIPIAGMFEDCNFVHEFVDNEVVEVAGLRITGHRGVPPINGTWADETSYADLYDRVRRMDPGCDLYLTHYPPEGVGLSHFGRQQDGGGGSVDNWLQYQSTQEYPIHMFGHIHEHGGKVHQLGKVTYSNAAECWNVIEGDPQSGWKDVSPL